jgi:hypothetical protein
VLGVTEKQRQEGVMLHGSCLCGAVRYELRGVPRVMYHCHCSTCRKASGAAAATNMLASYDEFHIVAGADCLASYESSPRKRRYFCSRCGSPIYSHAEATHDVVSLRCGALDDDPPLRPAAHLHVASQAPWSAIADGLPQLPHGTEE